LLEIKAVLNEITDRHYNQSNIFIMKKYFLVGGLLIFFSCTVKLNSNKSVVAPQDSFLPNGKLFTALYQQHAAEYKALCLQSFNMASIKLNQYVKSTDKPLVIVTDIDETVLDNSAFAVHQGLMGKEYEPEAWYDWTSKAQADTVPGAPAFLKYAASKGIQVFYITNREERERVATIKNLSLYNLPNADNQHLLLKTTTSGKEPRRQLVANDYEIVMLIGDNLSDFTDMFDKKTPQRRSSNVSALVNQWGNQFIVLPNPNYGDWEGALFNYNYKLSSHEKDSIYRTLLKTY
jgi:5'-nucleotidase (lipoprotein e(P4) family)